MLEYCGNYQESIEFALPLLILPKDSLPSAIGLYNESQ